MYSNSDKNLDQSIDSAEIDALRQRYLAVQQRIDLASHNRKTKPSLLAVSKTKPAWMIETLYELNQRDFGENYLQDALDKMPLLEHLEDLCWHFIGQIQSNKTKTIAENFSWVHSVDRLKIAKRLSEQRESYIASSNTNSSPLNICIQVNLDEEPNKAGVAPQDLLSLAEHIHTLPGITLRGLMCIPKARENEQEQVQCFQRLNLLLEALNQQGIACDTLSMGMSQDLTAAIQAGSTLLRIGNDIFGSRQP